MSLAVNDIKKGSLIIMEGDPYLVMLVSHQHIGRGSANTQLKVKNIVNGKIFDKTVKSTEAIEEAELERVDAQFIYARNGEYWFHAVGNPSNRFFINKETIGGQSDFLKPQMVVRALQFNGGIINIEIPVKSEYEVTEAPPNVKGNTAQGGTKQVTIETGAKVSTPMFVETGDVIRINTETGEYVERV